MAVTMTAAARRRFEVRLTDEQVDQFHRDGFTSVDRITTDEELEWIRPIYDYLFATKGHVQGRLLRPVPARTSPTGDDLVPQVLSPESRFPQLQRDERRPQRPGDRRPAARAGRVRAEHVEPPDPQAAARRRPAAVAPGRGVLGHRLRLPRPRRAGCRSTRRRSRAGACTSCPARTPARAAAPPHRRRPERARPRGPRSADDADARSPVPLAPGGATFHHCRTLHMTTPNVSDHVRRAWATEVQVEPRALPPGEQPDYPWVREAERGLEAPQARIAVERCGCATPRPVHHSSQPNTSSTPRPNSRAIRKALSSDGE